MATLKYPIGIQSFEEIRRDGWTYVDKTAYVHELVTNSRQIALYRPGGFGKSVLMSTFKAYFEGKKELFEGLALGELEKDWESYPVLHFKFGGMFSGDFSDLETRLHHSLSEMEKDFGVELNDDVKYLSIRFGDLIRNVARKTGKHVVVLIDDYDTVIERVVHDDEKFMAVSRLMAPFFAHFKCLDEYLRFVMVTGEADFFRRSLDSSANQFNNISLHDDYAAICGFTSDELQSVFAEGIDCVAEQEGITTAEAKDWIKREYGGYRFSRKQLSVYNPYSILHCMAEGHIKNYWHTTYDKWEVFVEYLKNSFNGLEETEEQWATSNMLLGSYSDSYPIPLLYQSGYLTIADYRRNRYRLKIANDEVLAGTQGQGRRP